MAYVVELPLDEGGDGAGQVVKVEVQEKPGDGLVKVARPGQVVARATRSMGEMLSGLRPVAQQLVNTFSETARGPQEITVEFGLSMSAEADIVISSSTAQAHFTVILKWDRSGNQAEDAGRRAADPEG
ncbi:CU044_2847 family protein [Streptomyces sp. 8N706]|uniref:CU044_2847 family protein n=1 Tax=Streptomyces sp. 8N706 TaxID=3457416 RepID=UPI003FD2DCA3